jgi:hypothetical protein
VQYEPIRHGLLTTLSMYSFGIPKDILNVDGAESAYPSRMQPKSSGALRNILAESGTAQEVQWNDDQVGCLFFLV